MDTTDVLSNYFMTVDMHRFDLMWLVYSRNKFFRVGPNISEKFVLGGTNFRGVQIKRDMPARLCASRCCKVFGDNTWKGGSDNDNGSAAGY